MVAGPRSMAVSVAPAMRRSAYGARRTAIVVASSDAHYSFEVLRSFHGGRLSVSITGKDWLVGRNGCSVEKRQWPSHRDCDGLGLAISKNRHYSLGPLVNDRVRSTATWRGSPVRSLAWPGWRSDYKCIQHAMGATGDWATWVKGDTLRESWRATPESGGRSLHGKSIHETLPCHST